MKIIFLERGMMIAVEMDDLSRLNYVRNRAARERASVLVEAWCLKGRLDHDYEILRKLLGCSHLSPSSFVSEGFTEEHLRVCKMLAGPNGYAIYKALEARAK